MNSLADRETYI